jgi:hypothetical protein
MAGRGPGSLRGASGMPSKKSAQIQYRDSELPERFHTGVKYSRKKCSDTSETLGAINCIQQKYL